MSLLQPAFRLLYFTLLLSYGEGSVRVCKDFQSYYNDSDHSCYNNTNPDKNVTEIVQKWHFNVEEYTVKTSDDYILTIIRLYDKITQKTPLVFGHGELQNSLRFVMRDKKSPAYYFGKKGFEIYLINFRGTIYSDKHVKLSCKNKDYWQFGFHEWGYHDLCAVLQFVKKKSGKKPIYIGDSTGATAGLVYASTKSKEAYQYMTGMILYGPLAHLYNIKSAYIWKILPSSNTKEFLDTFYNGRISQNNFQPEYCTPYPFQMYTCEFSKSLYYGDDFEGIDPTDWPLIYYVSNDKVSTKMVAHYKQLVHCGEFLQYDYGSKLNNQVYGQSKPPKYNTSLINVPVTILQGQNDWLSTTENNQCLYDTFSPQTKCGLCPLKCDKFNHADFEQHKDVVKLVFEPTMEAITNICENKCHK